MKKLRVFYLIAFLPLFIGSVFTFSGIARASEAPDGFMGIPWGASKDQINKTMSERGYEKLTGASPGSLAFRGAFAGTRCELTFDLTAGSLGSGSASHCQRGPYRQGPQRYFEHMVKMLSEKYGPPQIHDYNPVSAEDEKKLEAGGAAIMYAWAGWDFIDSRTSDKYSVRVDLYRVWSADGTLNYSVDIYYRADSLKERLEKQDY